MLFQRRKSGSYNDGTLRLFFMLDKGNANFKKPINFVRGNNDHANTLYLYMTSSNLVSDLDPVCLTLMQYFF